MAGTRAKEMLIGAAGLVIVVLLVAGCDGKKRGTDAASAPAQHAPTATAVEGAEGGGASSGVDTGLVLRGEDVGVCVGFESGDVLNSDGEGDSFGNFFWDPLDRADEVQHQGLGGISAYGNKVSIYFWTSADKAKQIYAAARAKHVADVERIGNAVVVGMSSLDPSAQSVVNDCLTTSN
jgi:hypothetical protein